MALGGDPDAALHGAQPGKFKPGSADAPPPPANPQEPGTLSEGVERLPVFAPVEPTRAPLEHEQSWGDWLSSGWNTFGKTASASKTVTAGDTTMGFDIALGKGYAPIVSALHLGPSENPAAFEDPYAGTFGQVVHGAIYGFSRADQEKRLAGLIKAARAKDPNAFPGVPDDPVKLRAYALAADTKERAAAQAAIAAAPKGLGTLGANLAGSAYGSFAAPENVLALPVGGGGKTLVSIAMREALVNGILTASSLPGEAKTRAERGEAPLTAGEAVTQVVGGAIGGAVLGTAFHGAGKALDATGIPQAVGRVVGNLDLANTLSYKIYSAMPEPLQRKWGAGIVTKWAKRLADGEKLEDVFSNLSNVELATLSKTVIGAEHLSPEERAAAEHLTRTEEVGDSSPFEPGPAGDGKHESSLAERLTAIIDNNPPPVERPSAPPVADSGAGALPSEPARPPAATSTAAARPRFIMNADGPRRLPTDIYEGLKARGIPEHLAAGIAAGVQAESRGDIHVLGPITAATHGDRALGLGQWLGTRKAELLRRYGPSPTLENQLDFLVWELKGGDSGGKAVLGARDEVEALHHYIKDFMRPAAGAETDKDLARGMTALGRGGEDVGELAGGSAPLDVPDDPEIARLREEALNLDDAVIGLSEKPDGSTTNAYARRVSVRDINVDADRFQFKAGGDQYGVTDRLRGIEDFDQVASGRVSLWQNLDGKLWVANGHQRTGLATRISDQTGKDIQLDATIWREADGVTAEDAMAMAALHNIGEDSGTVLDAAKLGRHNVQALENAAKRLPPKSAMVRDARALTKLSDDAFGAVYRGEVAPDHAAVIGHLVPDKPETHGALVDLLMKLEPANRAQAESIIRQAIAAGMHKGEQVDLFGSHEVFKSLMLERAKVLEKVLGALQKSKLLFKTAAKEADTLEAVGSKIAKTASEKEAQNHAQALELVQRLAFTHGPVGEILNDAARQLADGAKLGEVVDAAARAIRELDLGAVSRETARDDSSRLLDDGAGRDSGASEAGEAVREEQPSLTDLERATERFSNPDGPATKQQAESSFHDLKAAIAADEAFQLDRNSNFLVGLHGILSGAEEGQLGRYHWKLNHDPEGDWISVTADGEPGDGGDDVLHLLTKGAELVASGKVHPELAGELERIVEHVRAIGETRFLDTPAGVEILGRKVDALRQAPGGAKRPPTGEQILAGLRGDAHGGYLGNFTGMLRELEAKTPTNLLAARFAASGSRRRPPSSRRPSPASCARSSPSPTSPVITASATSPRTAAPSAGIIPLMET
jgi:hypothetical protein